MIVLRKSPLERFGETVNIILLLLIAAAMLFPFLYIFSVSFTSYQEYIQSPVLFWPKKWVLESYTYILHSSQFLRSMWVSIYVTIIGTIFSLIMTSTMSYALSRKIYGHRVYMFIVLFTFLFGAGIIPTYLVVRATGLIDTFWSLIIPVAINPFYLIVMRQFYYSIPMELTESALIDGANDMQTFTKIIIPLTKPAFAAFGLFYAVYYWNIYFSALIYLNNPKEWTVQVILRLLVILNQSSTLTSSAASQVARGAHPPPPETIGMAAILVATVPILLVYPFLQKHFVKGVMLGSVKG